MIVSPIKKTLTVGVSLSASTSFKADHRGENISVIAPVVNPRYTISIFAPSGALLATGVNVVDQYAVIPCRYALKGTVVLSITAADQGDYQVELHSQ